MRKLQFAAAFWTIIIALPFTLMAIVLSAYISNHLIALYRSVATYFQEWAFLSRDILFEAEIAGLLAGVLIIVGVLLLTNMVSNQEKKPGVS
jgi:hypothetical protein